MQTTKYTVFCDLKDIDLKFVCVADLHARPYTKILDELKKLSPDVILLPGDIVEIAAQYMNTRNQNGLNFLKECSSIAPTYYTYGNHELYNSHAPSGHTQRPEKLLGEKYLNIIKSYGITVINDEYSVFDTTNGKIYVGGLVCGRDKDPKTSEKEINEDFLDRFSCLTDGYKILLCHYPHYYNKYVKDTSIDLCLSGHAHGGQWRLFGRGIFAPHQGIFPKYTSGMHDGRLIISRGVVNNAKPIPRLFNPCEIILINLKSK